jgi:flagellar protein FlbD
VIRITKFDGSSVMLNPEQIQTIEATPDTVITLTTGLQIIVKDRVDELVAAFKDYKKSIFNSPWEARKQS